jgi:hypothetical protein
MARGSFAPAQNLQAGKGLQSKPRKPYARRAPLYPVLLAGLGKLGLAPRQAVDVCSCAAFALSFAAVYALATTLGASGLLTLLLWAGFAPPVFLLRIGMIDALVMACTVLAMAALARYLHSGSGRALLASLAASAVAGAGYYLAVLTWLPVLGLALLLNPKASGRRRLRDVLAYAAIACLPIGLWLLRNLQRTGHLTGMDRSGSRTRMDTDEMTLGFHFEGLWRTVQVDWWSPKALGLTPLLYKNLAEPWPDWGRWLALGSVLLLAAVVLLGSDGWLGWWRDQARETRLQRIACCLAFSYVLWYFAALLVIWVSTNNDPLSIRFVAPVYPVLLGLLVAGLTVLRGARLQALCRGALLLVLLTLAVVQIPKTWELWQAKPAKTLMRADWMEGTSEFWQRWQSW